MRQGDRCPRMDPGSPICPGLNSEGNSGLWTPMVQASEEWPWPESRTSPTWEMVGPNPPLVHRMTHVLHTLNHDWRLPRLIPNSMLTRSSLAMRMVAVYK